MIKNIFLVAVWMMSYALNAQISEVKYQIKFNESTSLYDCYMVVTKGNATTMRERVQFNAQYSLVVPAGTKITIAKSHMPLQGNKDLQGGKPMPWAITSEVFAPSADVNHDFVAIVPALNPTSFYNVLNEGSEVLLFSVLANPIPANKEEVRLFENHVDPSSIELGGGSFENGFTMGGPDQKYVGNIKNHKQVLIDVALEDAPIADVNLLASTSSRNIQNSQSIFPNPASSFVNIKISNEKTERVNVDLLDVNGKLLRQNVVRGTIVSGLYEAKVDITSLEAGVYFVAIKVGNDVENHKLIVIK